MSANVPEEDLLRQAAEGSGAALATLFEHHRDRLERMVVLRLDRRLAGRLDVSDVLQEAYLEVHQRFDSYREKATVPFFLWLRLVVGQKLIDLHRQHLGARMRDAGLEVSLQRHTAPEASTGSLAEQLLARLTTASEAAVRAEQKRQVQEVLDRMDALDREVLVLRHFEYLSNEETALVLGLRQSAASQRYIRALRRMKEALAAVPGLQSEP